MRRRLVDPEKMNPDWRFAYNHGKANKPGILNSGQNLRGSMMMCPCCLNVLQKQPVSLWQNSKELFFLGYGFPLFYNMLQFCLILLFMLILSNSGVMLYNAVNEDCTTKYHQPRTQITATHIQVGPRVLAATAGTGNTGNTTGNTTGTATTLDLTVQNACQSTFVLLSKSSSVLKDQDIVIRIVAWLGAFFMLLYFRDTQRKLSKYHRERNNKLSDYAVIFKNLPKVRGIQGRIKRFINDTNLFSNTHNVEQMILLPNVEEFYQKEKEKGKLIEEKKKFFADPVQNADQLNLLDAELARINEELFKMGEEITRLESEDQLISEKAIVILEREKDRKQLIDQFEKIDKGELFDYFGSRAYDVTLKSAPDPKEIIWRNANYPKNKRWLWVAFGWLISIVFLGSVTVVFYFLIEAKSIMFENSLHENQVNPNGQHTYAVMIVFLTIFGVQLFNKFVMKAVLHKICALQKPFTSAQLEFSYAFKYTLGMFFTTALMTLAVEAIRFDNYTNEYGVVEQESIIFFFNAFFVAFLWVIHPQYYIRKLMRWYYRGSKNMTQKEAGELMEDYPYDMGKRYAEVLQTMWFTFLYASLLPIGPFITFIGLSIYYWIDKYNLLRRSKLENVIESRLPLNAVTLLDMILIWKPAGDLIFDYQLRGGQLLPSTFIMLILGIIHIFFPWNKVLAFCFFQKFNSKNAKYKEIKYKFVESYRAVNPVLHHLSLPDFVDRLNRDRSSREKIPTFEMIQPKEHKYNGYQKKSFLGNESASARSSSLYIRDGKIRIKDAPEKTGRETGRETKNGVSGQESNLAPSSCVGFDIVLDIDDYYFQ